MDWVDNVLNRIGVTGSTSKALQFVFGIGVVALSLSNYSPKNNVLSIIGILLGGYLIIKSIEWKKIVIS